MTFLVAPEQVAIRMGLESLDALSDDRQETLLASLRATSIHLAAYLRHETFDAQDIVDTFLLRAEQHSPDGGGLQLALRQGFVTAAGVVVQLAASLPGLAAAAPVEATDQYVDRALGSVHVFSMRTFNSDLFGQVRGQYFARASYRAGFEVSGAGALQIYIGAPAWLQEAATMLALYAYKSGLDCEEVQTADLIKSSGLAGLVGAKSRWLPGAALPLVR